MLLDMTYYDFAELAISGALLDINTNISGTIEQLLEDGFINRQEVLILALEMIRGEMPVYRVHRLLLLELPKLRDLLNIPDHVMDQFESQITVLV